MAPFGTGIELFGTVLAPASHFSHFLGRKKDFREILGSLDFTGFSANYSMMLLTTPEPTVRPPSRIAKRKPSSIATG